MKPLMPSSLFVVAALLSCGDSEAEREAAMMAKATPRRMQTDGSLRLSEADRQALGLRVEAAAEASLATSSLRFGRAQARSGEEAFVVAPVAGRIARAPFVQLGAIVAADARLVELVPLLGAAERVSLGVQAADIAGQLNATQRELNAREADAARAKELVGSVVSEAALQQAETAVAVTRAKLEALERAQEVSVDGGGVTLRSSVAGTLVALDAPVGVVVPAGAVLARILKAGPRWIDLGVPADDVTGAQYEVKIGETWVAARLISRGAVVADDGARHDRLEVAGDVSVGLLPGASVAVRVAGEASRGIVISERALVPGDVVFVEASPGRFTDRVVRVVARFGGRARVEGLQTGDLIVTEGAMSLRGESLKSQMQQGD